MTEPRPEPTGATSSAADPASPAGPAADPVSPTPPTTQPTTPTPHRDTWRPDSDVDRTTPAWSTEPVAVRRADSVGAFLLLLAGLAAGLSLLLPWTPGGRNGLGLLRDGLGQLGSDWTGVFDSGLWEPLAVLFGGGVLLLLGLLLLVPAKAHRFPGVLALLVALVVVAGVLVPWGQTGWDLSEFDLGFYVALGVAGLGLLGALKAALTGRKHA